MTGGDPSGIHHLSNCVISPLAGWERMKSDTPGVACREEGQSGCISFALTFGRTTVLIKLRLQMITNEDSGDLLRLSQPNTAIHSDFSFYFTYLNTCQTFTDFHIHNQNGHVFFFFIWIQCDILPIIMKEINVQGSKIQPKLKDNQLYKHSTSSCRIWPLSTQCGSYLSW